MGGPYNQPATGGGTAYSIVFYVHILLRVQIELAPEGLSTDFMFWGLLAIWELGLSSAPQALARPRPAGGVAAQTGVMRRRELWEGLASRFVGKGSLAARMTSNLMSETDPALDDLASAAPQKPQGARENPALGRATMTS